uniref:DEP domain-containing protein n=1 Tax=Plectus sambesii TaxID=2011161 RepID=A0A914VZH9_9BILA
MVAELKDAKGSVLIYSIVACPRCMKAKNRLTELGIPYKEVSLDNFPQCREEMEARTNGKTSLPQIFFNEIHIGGVEELDELISDKARFEEMVQVLQTNEAPAEAPVAPQAQTEADYDTDDGQLGGEPDEYSRLVRDMKKANLIKDHRVGLIKTHKNAFKGQDLIDWLIKAKKIDRKHALEMGQELIDRNFGQETSNKGGDTFSPDRYYQLLEDDETLALNAGTPAETTPLRPGELSDTLRRLIQCVYDNNVSKDGKTVDYEAIAEDEDFERYVALSKELQRVDFTLSTREEKIALFINVYNALVVHASVKVGPPTNMWQRWKFFNTVHYLVGSYLFSLHAMENGVLRANRKGVGKMWRPFAKNDERLKIVLEEPEPLIHFALNKGTKGSPPINTYSAKGLNDELKAAAESFLESDEGVKIDSGKKTVSISKLFKWYADDFGGSADKALEWIMERMPAGDKKNQLTKLFIEGQYSIEFLNFDWAPNGKEKEAK